MAVVCWRNQVLARTQAELQQFLLIRCCTNSRNLYVSVARTRRAPPCDIATANLRPVARVRLSELTPTPNHLRSLPLKRKRRLMKRSGNVRSLFFCLLIADWRKLARDSFEYDAFGEPNCTPANEL